MTDAMQDLRDEGDIAERCADAWAQDNTRTVDGVYEFRCPVCGEWCALSEATPTSPSPTALPLCPSCAELCERANDGDDDASARVIEITARMMREGKR